MLLSLIELAWMPGPMGLGVYWSSAATQIGDFFFRRTAAHLLRYRWRQTRQPSVEQRDLHSNRSHSTHEGM